MCDEMAGRFHSNSSLLHGTFSSRACDARAFPGILHFLLSQPSHLAFRCQAFLIGDNISDVPEKTLEIS